MNSFSNKRQYFEDNMDIEDSTNEGKKCKYEIAKTELSKKRHNREESFDSNENLSDILELKKVKLNDDKFSNKFPEKSESEHHDIDFPKINNILFEFEMIRRYRRNISFKPYTLYNYDPIDQYQDTSSSFSPP